ncbi:MAG: SGNH/GDSL hydrolase family protein [Patescibacteria group bacterium]|jgi:hypothetical protein
MSKPSLFVIGDSVSVDYGTYLCRYLRETFQYSRKQGTNEVAWNHGVAMGANGGDSSLVLKYLCSNYCHKEISKVDYLLLNCGLHDIKVNPASKKKQISLIKYWINLLLILRNVNRFADHVVWVNSTPVNDEIHNTRCKDFFRFNKDVLAYNNVAKNLMQKFDIPIINLYSFTLKCGKNIYTDHVHFKKTVSQKQGKFIASFLLKHYHLNSK